MKVGILGSGIVGQTLGAKLVSQGHDVVLGTRDPSNMDGARGMGGMGAPLGKWLKEGGKGAKVGTFRDAATHGELIIHSTAGEIALKVIDMAGKENLRGKVILDTSNDLDLSHGFPPATRATDYPAGSVAVKLQEALPEAHVVKALNTMTANLMVAPGSLAGGDHTVFISGNDAAAKATVTKLLQSWGWKDVFDTGDIKTSTGPEMLFALWAKAFGQLGMKPFNFKVVR
jgi:8-hydroxy-5-deazaflavin:NADPH oxidoreductase